MQSDFVGTNEQVKTKGLRCDLNYRQSPPRKPTKGPNMQLERLIGRCEQDNKSLKRIHRVLHTSGLLVYFYCSTYAKRRKLTRVRGGGRIYFGAAREITALFLREIIHFLLSVGFKALPCVL